MEKIDFDMKYRLNFGNFKSHQPMYAKQNSNHKIQEKINLLKKEKEKEKE